jgi:hypothetical protein
VGLEPGSFEPRVIGLGDAPEQREPGEDQRQRSVGGGQLWHQLAELEDEAERRAPQLGPLGLADRVERLPSNQTSPASEVNMPARQCSRVDLPEPLGPMTATSSSASTTLVNSSVCRCGSASTGSASHAWTSRRPAVVMA